MMTIKEALDKMPCSDESHMLEQLESWIREVQLDARKQGMLDAAAHLDLLYSHAKQMNITQYRFMADDLRQLSEIKYAPR